MSTPSRSSAGRGPLVAATLIVVSVVVIILILALNGATPASVWQSFFPPPPATDQAREIKSLYDLVFYKYYKTKDFDPDKVLASVDDNFASPLFLEKGLDEGKVILLTSTIDHEWNAGIQAHPPFLPLMWDLCRYLSSRPSARRNLFVGDLIHLDLPVELYQPPFILDTPTEGSVTLPASTPERDQKFFRLFYPSRTKSDDPKAFKNEGVRNAGKYRLLRNAASSPTCRARRAEAGLLQAAIFTLACASMRWAPSPTASRRTAAAFPSAPLS